MKINKKDYKKLIDYLNKNTILSKNTFNLKIPHGIKKEDCLTSTINTFCSIHDVDKRFFSTIKPVLKKFIKYDMLINVENKIVCKEIYKILFLINQTDKLLDFHSSNKYNNKFFIKYNTKAKIKKNMQIHKSQVINKEVMNLGEHRLNWYFKSMYLRNKNIALFYSYIFTLINLNEINIKDVNLKSNIEIVKFHTHKLLTSNTNENDIQKNLSILLYFQFNLYFKTKIKTRIKINQCKEYTQEIMFKLFNYDVNFEEFNKNIYLKSMVNSTPIFGAKKEKHFNENEEELILKNLSKAFPMFDNKTAKSMVKIFLKHSHINILQKYPVELFSKK